MSDEGRSQFAAKQVLHLLLDERQENMPEVARPVVTPGLVDAILRVGYDTQFDRERVDIRKQIRETVLEAMKEKASAATSLESDQL